MALPFIVGRIKWCGFPLHIFVVIGLLLMFAIGSRTYWLPHFLGTDPTIYKLVGQKIVSGAIPYRDIWDNKLPVTYYINAISFLLSGYEYWGMALINTLCAAVTILCTVTIACRWGGIMAWTITGLTTTIWILNPNISRGGHPEQYASTFASVSMWMLLCRYAVTRASTWAFMAGHFAALSLLSKVTSLGFSFIALLGILALHRKHQSQINGYYSAVWLYLLGLVWPVGAFVMWLIWVDAFPAFRSAVIDLGTHLRAGVPITTTLLGMIQVASFSGFDLAVVLLGVSIIVGVRGMLNGCEEERLSNVVLTMVGLWGMVEVTGVFATGFPNSHYWISFAPPAGLCLGLVSDRYLTRSYHRMKQYAVAAVLCGVLLRGVPYFVWNAVRTNDTPPKPYRQEAAALLIAFSKPDEPVFIWSKWNADAVIYWLARRKSASRFLYVKDLLRPGFTRAWHWAALRTDLMINRPVIMICSRSDMGSFVVGAQRNAGNVVRRFTTYGLGGQPIFKERDTLQQISALACWMDREYQFVKETDHWFVYRLRSTKQ